MLRLILLRAAMTLGLVCYAMLRDGAPLENAFPATQNDINLSSKLADESHMQFKFHDKILKWMGINVSMHQQDIFRLSNQKSSISMTSLVQVKILIIALIIKGNPTFPPAETSKAVAFLVSLTLINLATRPLTFLRSKFGSGSLKLKFSCEYL